MSSSRKRAAVHKAHAETEHLRQKLGLVEHQYTILKLFSELAAAECQGWRQRFPTYEYRRQDDCVALKMAPVMGTSVEHLEDAA
jgi:hypothetical protein